MNENLILTLEQISEIDTFTLEEKVEELQRHPHAQLYDQLIAIAKLELHERYKIEEFARMLVNDQIPFPEIHTHSETHIPHNPMKSFKKIDLAESLKKSLVPHTDQLLIGKPSVGNYRYVPRQPASLNKSKKSTVRDPKKADQGVVKGKFQKKAGTLPKIPTMNNIKVTKTIQPKQESQPKTSPIEIRPRQPHFQFKNPAEKEIQIFHKSETKKPAIKYIENDVYDGQKLILDAPQNLAQIQLETDTSVKDEGEEDIPQQKLPNSQKEELTDKHMKQMDEQIKEQIQCVGQLEITQQMKIESNEVNSGSDLALSSQRVDQNKSCMMNNKQDGIEPKSSRSEQTDVGSTMNKIKSISHSVQVIKSFDLPDDPSEPDLVAITSGFTTGLEPGKWKETGNLGLIKHKKISVGQKCRLNLAQNPQKLMPVYFNYHQIVPTFSKLFPHSTSLINDLRSIENQLSDHLEKKVNDVCLGDEYLRTRENELLFKVVSESEKAHKYAHMFDISLDSYFSRSKAMIDRIKKNTNPPQEQNMLLYRVVRQKQDVYDIINNAFHRTDNWYELPHGMELKTSWNLLWTWSRPQIDIKELFYFQKVNHFFGNKQIARKDLLKKNIQRIKKLGPKAKASFDIIPETYFLPGENMQFVRKFREHSNRPGLNYWIMKPVGLSRGRGIELVTKIEEIVFSEPVVIQKYLENPLLLNGYKFDMRIYVLVTSINPLQAYVYREGFARISTQKYSLEDEEVHNKFVHLTNFSVQKQSFEQENRPKQFDALSTLEKQLGGCKITLKGLKEKLSEQNISWEAVESQIDSIVLKSLISTMNVIDQNPNCFELFGYDIIIDQNIKCWLIEVNSSPSLEKDFTIDQIVKQQLVDDIIDIVSPVSYDRSRLLEVVTRRRKQLEGLKSHIKTHNNSASQLNADLHYILHGRKLRRYGEPVENRNFRRVAPGESYNSIIRTVQQYKLSSITKQQTC